MWISCFKWKHYNHYHRKAQIFHVSLRPCYKDGTYLVRPWKAHRFAHLNLEDEYHNNLAWTIKSKDWKTGKIWSTWEYSLPHLPNDTIWVMSVHKSKRWHDTIKWCKAFILHHLDYCWKALKRQFSHAQIEENQISSTCASRLLVTLVHDPTSTSFTQRKGSWRNIAKLEGEDSL